MSTIVIVVNIRIVARICTRRSAALSGLYSAALGLQGGQVHVFVVTHSFLLFCCKEREKKKKKKRKIEFLRNVRGK